MPLKRVLIVEDEPLVALDLESAVRDAGYEVIGPAATHAEAIRLAKASRPELALVDVQLAAGDGRDVARELSHAFETAVLMVTAENAASLQGIGAQGVLPKPYDVDDIPKALKAVGRMAAGQEPGALPDHMKPLRPDGK